VWKEAQERTIKLPEDDPEVFSVYQEWLYDGLIHTGSQTLFPATDDEYEALVKAYILGEKLMDQDFKDATIDATLDKFRNMSRFDTGLTTRHHPGHHFAAFGWMSTTTLAVPNGWTITQTVILLTPGSWPNSVATRCRSALVLARSDGLQCFWTAPIMGTALACAIVERYPTPEPYAFPNLFEEAHADFERLRCDAVDTSE
jgi:hypothetical protein